MILVRFFILVFFACSVVENFYTLNDSYQVLELGIKFFYSITVAFY